jgi:hypothetical protein
MGFGDIDGDGRGDIVAQNGWLRAPEDRRNGHWEWHPDYTIERGSIPMLVVDPDEDGDNDIVWSSAHGFGVYWLEHVNVDGKRKFVRHAIDTSWSQGHSPLWEDLDGDGQPELITGKRYMAHDGADPGEYDPIALYRYQYNLATKSWDRWVMSPIGERVGVGLDPKVADIDGDGDLDFLASGRSGLYWLENLGPRTSTEPRWSAPEYPAGSSAMLLIDANGKQSTVADAESFGLRRTHIVAAIERSHGSLPSSVERIRLGTKVKSERAGDKFSHQTIIYQIDAARSAAASLLIPNKTTAGEATGVVCLFDVQDADLAQSIAAELAERGFVCVVPELLPTHSIIDSVWQAMRAADLLQACPAVHGERIAYVGNALNGELGIYVSAMDQRFIATLSDVSKAATLSAMSTNNHYGLNEILAATCPRSLAIHGAAGDVATALSASQPDAIQPFILRNEPTNLVIDAPALTVDGPAAYEWLASQFRRGGFGRGRRGLLPGGAGPAGVGRNGAGQAETQ